MVAVRVLAWSAVWACGSALASGVSADVTARPPSEPRCTTYPGNRPPLQSGALIKLPAASFTPGGWLGAALLRQRDGLTGHLGEISRWLVKEDNAWLRADGRGKWGWEEVPYWLRGYSRLAYVLHDAAMLKETMVWVEATLASQRPDGDFGPVQLRKGTRDLWAQMLMLQVLQAHFEFSGDERVVPFMTRYFRWQNTIPDDQFLEDFWENSRGGDNLASVYWLFNRTGDAFLLDLAIRIDRNTADWRREGDLPNWHVVNIAECFREPATYWLQSARKEDLDASYRNFDLARRRFGQVPGGMFGADENARPGFTDPHQASETCAFVEQIWSNLVMSEITGDPRWTANTEDVAFNSLPAAFTPDWRALRYLTAPNQVTSDAKNHAPGVANEGPFFLMNPFSSRCCQHNHSSAWVNLAEHAWMATNDDGLAALVHVAGEVRARVGRPARPALVRVETAYPFDGEVRLTFVDARGTFPMYLLIPGWAEGAGVRVNGAGIEVAPRPGAYIRLEREWKPGDTVELTLPMRVAVRTWEQNGGSVSVDRGPLTYSLKIEERYSMVASDMTAQHDAGWRAGADPAKWPSFEILPGSPWNFALVVDRETPGRSFSVVRRTGPLNVDPFTNDGAPVVLEARGRRVPAWTLDAHGLAGKVPLSPVESVEPVEMLTLVPMGGARLRISAFPVTAR